MTLRGGGGSGTGGARRRRAPAPDPTAPGGLHDVADGFCGSRRRRFRLGSRGRAFNFYDHAHGRANTRLNAVNLNLK